MFDICFWCSRRVVSVFYLSYMFMCLRNCIYTLCWCYFFPGLSHISKHEN